MFLNLTTMHGITKLNEARISCGLLQILQSKVSSVIIEIVVTLTDKLFFILNTILYFW